MALCKCPGCKNTIAAETHLSHLRLQPPHASVAKALLLGQRLRPLRRAGGCAAATTPAGRDRHGSPVADGGGNTLKLKRVVPSIDHGGRFPVRGRRC